MALSPMSTMRVPDFKNMSSAQLKLLITRMQFELDVAETRASVCRQTIMLAETFLRGREMAVVSAELDATEDRIAQMEQELRENF